MVRNKTRASGFLNSNELTRSKTKTSPGLLASIRFPAFYFSQLICLILRTVCSASSTKYHVIVRAILIVDIGGEKLWTRLAKQATGPTSSIVFCENSLPQLVASHKRQRILYGSDILCKIAQSRTCAVFFFFEKWCAVPCFKCTCLHEIKQHNLHARFHR